VKWRNNRDGDFFRFYRWSAALEVDKKETEHSLADLRPLILQHTLLRSLMRCLLERATYYLFSMLYIRSTHCIFSIVSLYSRVSQIPFFLKISILLPPHLSLIHKGPRSDM